MSEYFGSPSISVVFTFEERPRIIWDAIDDYESERIADWVTAHPAYLALIEAAVRLVEQERARERQ